MKDGFSTLHLGRLVINKRSGKIGVVLREWEEGNIQVLESIQPYVINTHDNWSTLSFISEFDQGFEHKHTDLY